VLWEFSVLRACVSGEVVTWLLSLKSAGGSSEAGLTYPREHVAIHSEAIRNIASKSPLPTLISAPEHRMVSRASLDLIQWQMGFEHSHSSSNIQGLEEKGRHPTLQGTKTAHPCRQPYHSERADLETISSQ
jgi:hypothetical protein